MLTFNKKYFDFNGTSSQISIADNVLLEPGSGNWTMEVWFKADSVSGSQVVLGKFDPGGASIDVSYSIITFINDPPNNCINPYQGTFNDLG